MEGARGWAGSETSCRGTSHRGWRSTRTRRRRESAPHSMLHARSAGDSARECERAEEEGWAEDRGERAGEGNGRTQLGTRQAVGS
eukprot:2532047-Rhodomonas_salina.2